MDKAVKMLVAKFVEGLDYQPLHRKEQQTESICPPECGKFRVFFRQNPENYFAPHFGEVVDHQSFRVFGENFQEVLSFKVLIIRVSERLRKTLKGVVRLWNINYQYPVLSIS